MMHTEQSGYQTTMSQGGWRVAVIAEVGSSHGGSYKRAQYLVRAARTAGADAVKVQVYDADDLVGQGRDGGDAGGRWTGRTLRNLYDEAATPREWLPGLLREIERGGMTPVASVFRLGEAEELVRAGWRWLKVSSAEALWPELVEDVLAAGADTVLVSDGMVAGHDERGWLDAVLGEHAARGRGDVGLLRCVSSYPATAREYAWGDLLASEWGWAGGRPYRRPRVERMAWGVSLHALGDDARLAVAAAVGSGARYIEAHIRAEGDRVSPDAAHAWTPAEFGDLVVAVRLAERARSRIGGAPYADTLGRWRRGLVWADSLDAGTLVTDDHVMAVRGAGPYAVTPRQWRRMADSRRYGGLRTTARVSRGDAVRRSDIEAVHAWPTVR